MREHVLLLALLLLPAPAAAQGWTVDLYGGEVTYESATAAGEAGALLGLRYRDPEVGWFRLSSGIPFGSGDSLWGAAGLGRRLAYDAGRFELGGDLELNGYLHRDPSLEAVGTGGTAAVRPLVAVAHPRVRLEARSGWVHYGARIADWSTSRGVHDSDARLDVAVGPNARVSGGVRHVRADGFDPTRLDGRLTLRSGRATVWASVGEWLTEELPTTGWSVGASFGLDEAGRTSLGVSYSRDATDPIYWNAPRERWSVGVSHRLGGSPAPDRPDRLPDLAIFSTSGGAPDRAGAEVAPGGRVTIRIPAGDVPDGGRAPAVAGNFTGWDPVPMERDGEQWVAEFELEPGVYRYAFRSPDGEWYVPESVPGRRDDGMGGFVAVFIVP